MKFYKHDQLFLLLCYYISRRDRQESVINLLKSTAYRNKSLKIGYRTVNARKYVRYARTFYLYLE